MSKSLSLTKSNILTKSLFVPRPMVTSYGRLKFSHIYIPNHRTHYNSLVFSMIWNSSPDLPSVPAVPEVSHLLPFGTSSTGAGGVMSIVVHVLCLGTSLNKSCRRAGSHSSEHLTIQPTPDVFCDGFI